MAAKIIDGKEISQAVREEYRHRADKLIEELNQSTKIHGILVQLPLPAHIDEKKVLEAR